MGVPWSLKYIPRGFRGVWGRSLGVSRSSRSDPAYSRELQRCFRWFERVSGGFRKFRGCQGFVLKLISNFYSARNMAWTRGPEALLQVCFWEFSRVFQGISKGFIAFQGVSGRFNSISVVFHGFEGRSSSIPEVLLRIPGMFQIVHGGFREVSEAFQGF